jgi:hypothetical protein
MPWISRGSYIIRVPVDLNDLIEEDVFWEIQAKRELSKYSSKADTVIDALNEGHGFISLLTGDYVLQQAIEASEILIGDDLDVLMKCYFEVAKKMYSALYDEKLFYPYPNGCGGWYLCYTKGKEREGEEIINELRELVQNYKSSSSD